MKKKGVISNYIISVIICQVLCLGGVFLDSGFTHAEEATSDASAEVAPEKLAIVSKHCDAIKSSLKIVQKNDARARVYLGAYYEKILTKYVTALNLKLVESNISDLDLIENQHKFAKAKQTFNDDFISYQKGLEELIAVDCKNAADKFYEGLVKVRKKQAVMTQDMSKLTSLIHEQKKLVGKLKERL